GYDAETKDGNVVANKAVTLDPEPPLSYAYCSDTAYRPEIAAQIEGAGILYHEATFLEEHLHLAEKTKHCTAKQAGAIAKKAKVGTLILGHYSGRYRNLELFRAEAQQLFPNVELAGDGKEFIF
ncbi:MAG: ribonuclease Z, partial [Marinirhabdus sp.]